MNTNTIKLFNDIVTTMRYEYNINPNISIQDGVIVIEEFFPFLKLCSTILKYNFFNNDGDYEYKIKIKKFILRKFNDEKLYINIDKFLLMKNIKIEVDVFDIDLYYYIRNFTKTTTPERLKISIKKKRKKVDKKEKIKKLFYFLTVGDKKTVILRNNFPLLNEIKMPFKADRMVIYDTPMDISNFNIKNKLVIYTESFPKMTSTLSTINQRYISIDLINNIVPAKKKSIWHMFSKLRKFSVTNDIFFLDLKNTFENNLNEKRRRWLRLHNINYRSISKMQIS